MPMLPTLPTPPPLFMPPISDPVGDVMAGKFGLDCPNCTDFVQISEILSKFRRFCFHFFSGKEVSNTSQREEKRR